MLCRSLAEGLVFCVLGVFLFMGFGIQDAALKCVDVQHSSLGCFKVVFFQISMLTSHWLCAPRATKAIMPALQISKKWRDVYHFLLFRYMQNAKSWVAYATNLKETDLDVTFAKFDISLQAYRSSGRGGWCQISRLSFSIVVLHLLALMLMRFVHCQSYSTDFGHEATLE